MAINYVIQAEVVDLRSDTPQATDRFLVDTNVWYWMTYTRASMGETPPASYQTRDYPGYVKKALAASATLNRCGLSMSELAHIIERCECHILNHSTVPPGTAKPKECRHNPAHRSSVTSEIQAAWHLVKGLSTPLDVTIDDASTDAGLCRIVSHTLDGYDAFIVDALLTQGGVQVITDDGDYANVPGLRVFTANRNVIRLAQQQGKLVVR